MDPEQQQPDTAIPDAATQPAQTDGDRTAGHEEDAATGLTQAQIDGIVQSRLAEERRKIQAKYGDLDAAAKKAAEFDKLKEAELTEFERIKKQLADKDAEIAAANQKADAERLNALRLRVGQEVGLPPVLSARLQGADEDELKADAEAVKAVLGEGVAPHVPNIDATAGGHQAVRGRTAGKLTAAQRAIADQYNISYEKYAETLQQFEE